MCQKTLAKSSQGYVIKCGNCPNLHVAFGTVLLSLSADQFCAFSKTLARCYDVHKCRDNREEKCIQVPTELSSLMLVFTLNELADFQTLLQSAYEALRRERLLEFNLN